VFGRAQGEIGGPASRLLLLFKILRERSTRNAGADATDARAVAAALDDTETARTRCAQVRAILGL